MSCPSKRYSLSPPQSTAESTHNLKLRVITALNKLADRDTLAVAAAELEGIARSLSHDSFSPFLNCIHNTDSSSKSPVRKQCVHLLTVLSNFHGDALSPFLSKMISTIISRIRDPDSAVRTACVDAVTAMSSRITKPPFSAFLKPLMEALTQEQDVNSQIGAALCLAAAVESAPEPDVESLRKSTLPKLGKLAKNEVCKAKAAVLMLIGSVVGVGGASCRGVLNWLVPSLVEFLGNEDWGVRKAAAEALGKVALVENALASQYKAQCLDSFENRRFDKVKLVRQTMNRSLEMWKEVTDALEDVPTAAKSTCSILVRGEGQSITKTSADVGLKSSQPKKTGPKSRSPPPTVSCLSTIKRENRLKNNDKKSSLGLSRELDHKECPDRKLQTTESNSSPSNMCIEDDIKRCNIEVSKSKENQNSRNSRADVKRGLFSKSSDEKLHKFGGLRSRSRVFPFNEDSNLDSDGTVNRVNEVCESTQDSEDLSLIREQLVQIENQQSSLLDLLQRFIGSSQSGMNYLERRVNGLEMALDKISHDLAVSSGRIPNSDSTEDTCCKLPGAEFLSPKFWKKTEGRYSMLRLSMGSTASPKAVHNAADKGTSVEMLTTNSSRFQHCRGGLFVNPLADVSSDLKGHLGQHTFKTPSTMVQDAERTLNSNARRLDGIIGISPTTCATRRNQNSRLSVKSIREKKMSLGLYS